MFFIIFIDVFGRSFQEKNQRIYLFHEEMLEFDRKTLEGNNHQKLEDMLGKFFVG